jgi:MerR family copper efflux transcriptional regulator
VNDVPSDLLRIGELATRAGVSPRTVDYYTGLGLLTPSRRSGGNFRLYLPTDVQRIGTIRQLEAHGLRLDEIVHLLNGGGNDGHAGCAEVPVQECQADPRALGARLADLVEQARALQGAADGADAVTRGVLATLASRAQALIAAGLLLAGDLVPGVELLPPL